MLKRLKYKVIRTIENNMHLHIFSDKAFLQAEFFSSFGKDINWDNPQSFSEKLQWLKINDRREIYVSIVDKFEAKHIISNVIGEQYVIPTLGMWDKYSKIDFNTLPNQFVLKCTHDSGGIFICKDKSRFDEEKCRNVIENALNRNFFYVGREWPYMKITPRIMAEEYIRDDENNDGLTDYKIHCFNGVPKVILVCQNRFDSSGIRESFYDTDWNLLDVKRPGKQQCSPELNKPNELNQMLGIAKSLARGIPFIRVDLYLSRGKIYFGELTLYPASGFIPFEPESYDNLFGEWLKL